MWGENNKIHRNDFYPWATIKTETSFELYISEEERSFVFPRLLCVSEFWTVGDTTNIHLELQSEDKYCPMNAEHNADLDRTTYKFKSTNIANNQYDMIFSTTLHTLPIRLVCYF